MTKWLTQYRTYGTGTVKVYYNEVLHPRIFFFPGSFFPPRGKAGARPPPYATETHVVLLTCEASHD